MSRHFIFLITITLFFSCNSSFEREKEHTKKKEIIKVETLPVVSITKPKEKKLPPINNETVEKRLMAYGKQNSENEVVIYTSKGKITIRLFDDTPLHRANFIMLAKRGYFKKSVFTRVVKGFMAQAGGTYTDDHKVIKEEFGKYTIPAEMSHQYFHKKGAVGMARLYINNDEKRSASYAFYFVEGTKYSKKALKHYEEENKYTYTDQQKEYYLKYPGAAHIDGEHTVFGQIVDGFEVVPKLTEVKTDSRDWPLTDLFIDSVVVLKK